MACMEGYIITLITFLHFPFSNVSSRCLHNWTKNCINYNSFDFLRYGFSMVSPWHFYQSTKSHTNCICLINTRAPDGVLGVSEFCCKSEIKENWKVIWQKPRESRESRSLGSLGSLGVSNHELYYSLSGSIIEGQLKKMLHTFLFIKQMPFPWTFFCGKIIGFILGYNLV